MNSRFNFVAAIFAGKMTMWLVRFLKKGQGSSLPGLVALKICPKIPGHLAKGIRRGVVIVTGTNGKTTTNNMLVQAARKAGLQVVANTEGANLITGVTTAFLKAASLFGRVDRDYAFLEVDEASLPLVTRHVSPDIVVVTNFFRDQLDRYGELDKTISFIQEALAKLPAVRLALNADDPLVAQLAGATGLKAVFYGLGERVEQEAPFFTAAQEGRFCPRCGQELNYDYYQYGQLGRYRCPGCSFSRPFAPVEGVQVFARDEAVRCRLVYPGGSRPLAIPTPGLYNLYNGLAAFTACLLLNLDPERTIRSLGRYVPAVGRMERFCYRKKPVLLNLAKNPAGFNEGLKSLLALPGTMDLLIAINDNDADGKDISWLWDVDFEVLAQHHRRLNSLVCTGLRGAEMALRLKYAGVPTEKIATNEMKEAVPRVLRGSGAAAYFLATYTALWPLKRILKGYVEKESKPKSLPFVP